MVDIEEGGKHLLLLSGRLGLLIIKGEEEKKGGGVESPVF